jgi:predicted dehydrogenase
MLPTVFPEPQMFTRGSGEPALRWGVIAPGGIATAFAQAMLAHTDQRLEAVASRSLDRSEAFAARFGIPRVHAGYEALVADPDVDVVYVASPASFHVELGMLALDAGKHTLIEKPLATTAADARMLVDAARSRGVFLMEAMWTRYLPQSAVIRTLLADGVIGAPRGVFASLSQAIPADPGHRLYRPELGGGALLDMGIYPVQLDAMVNGSPSRITAVGGEASTGVDAYATLVLNHGDSVQSTLMTSMIARSDSAATIFGADGRIEITGPHHTPTALTLLGNDLFGPRLHWVDPTGMRLYDGLSWEATALARFVGEGRTESPLHTLDETVSILETIDEARRQVHASAAARG